MRAMILWCALAAGVAACGGSDKPATIGARGGGGAETTEADTVLRALADAAKRDDGKALDALVHPTYGLVLWDQPGAWVSPTVTIQAGRGQAPSAWIADVGMNDYWLEQYWPQVAEGIDQGLAKLDRDPADRMAAVYGDCGTEDSGGPDLRAWIVSSESFDDGLRSSLEDASMELDPKVLTDLVHFRRWGLQVWLVRDQGRLWVAHIMVSTPCDA